jgi:hypothetical protein
MKIFSKLFNFFQGPYDYVNGLNFIYIKISDKMVYVYTNGERDIVLKVNNGFLAYFSRNFKMDDETFAEIQKIEAKKREKEEKLKKKEDNLKFQKRIVEVQGYSQVDGVEPRSSRIWF